jgi:hypothetical protein
MADPIPGLQPATLPAAGVAGHGLAGLLGGDQTGPDPPMSKRAAPLLRSSLLALPLLAALALSGCDRKGNEQSRRIDQLELKIQQLETRINQISSELKQPERGPRLPKGAIRSLTYRTAEDGNRLRIYWADGSQSDLECNQEQATLACG